MSPAAPAECMGSPRDKQTLGKPYYCRDARARVAGSTDKSKWAGIRPRQHRPLYRKLRDRHVRGWLLAARFPMSMCTRTPYTRLSPGLAYHKTHGIGRVVTSLVLDSPPCCSLPVMLSAQRTCISPDVASMFLYGPLSPCSSCGPLVCKLARSGIDFDPECSRCAEPPGQKPPRSPKCRFPI
jgi:hypothetical protein